MEQCSQSNTWTQGHPEQVPGHFTLTGRGANCYRIISNKTQINLQTFLTQNFNLTWVNSVNLTYCSKLAITCGFLLKDFSWILVLNFGNDNSTNAALWQTYCLGTIWAQPQNTRYELTSNTKHQAGRRWDELECHPSHWPSPCARAWLCVCLRSSRTVCSLTPLQKGLMPRLQMTKLTHAAFCVSTKRGREVVFSRMRSEITIATDLGKLCHKFSTCAVKCNWSRLPSPCRLTTSL